MTELHLFQFDRVSKVNLEKIELQFSEGSKAKSPSNIASFPSIIFLIIIINHNIAFFYSSDMFSLIRLIIYLCSQIPQNVQLTVWTLKSNREQLDS